MTSQGQTPGFFCQERESSPFMSVAESSSNMPSSRNAKHLELETKTFHSNSRSGGSIYEDSAARTTGIDPLLGKGSRDGYSPPLVLDLGPGDFFGEAAVLGQKQSTSALSTEYSTFQVNGLIKYYLLSIISLIHNSNSFLR
jgi:hypothetical protein